MNNQSFFANRLNITSLVIIALLLSVFYILPKPDNRNKAKEKIVNENFDNLDELIKNLDAYHARTVRLKGVASIISINHKNNFYGFRFYANNQKIFVGTYNNQILPNKGDEIILTGTFYSSHISKSPWGEYPYVIEAIEIQKVN